MTTIQTPTSSLAELLCPDFAAEHAAARRLVAAARKP
jgi:hypothetical protein